ncbi:hypothetical protein [Flavobacterium sp. 14A]|uniref:hypothetical protein n=1 Tax=Flavobacterium sp. 14A TaxID=2735896 RepID=UPI00157010CD|nr:hypothetical protein [Flavobacterium sp. 14A]NRT13570.1 hypothetical protein [Flavobacterium sp. 14A]
MKESYIGIFEDKSTIRKENFSELIAIPYLKYIFKSVTDDRLVNHYCLNRDGNQETLKFGRFEIIDIGPGKRQYFEGRRVRISEDGGKKTHLFMSYKYNSVDFIVNDLLHLIEILLKIDDWNIFMELQKIPKLEKQVEDLTKQRDLHFEEISDLKKQLGNK